MKLLNLFSSNVNGSLSEKLGASWKAHKKKPLWGVKDSAFRYDWLTFDLVFSKAQTLGLSLPLREGDIAVICIPNNANFIVADLACSFRSVVSLPLDPLSSITTGTSLVALAQPKLAFGTADTISYLRSIGFSDSNIVNLSRSVPDSVEFDPAKLTHLSALEDETRLFTLQPTSGSTGIPKLLKKTRAQFTRIDHSGKDITMLVGSLSSPAPRMWMWLEILSGGSVAESSAQTLIEDCQLVHPTQVSLPPLVWEMVCHRITSGLIQPTANAEGSIDWMQNLFGPNCKAVTNTGAAIAPTTWNTMKRLFPAARDGYGASETGGIALNGHLLAGVEIKLRDLPELGYFSSDSPFPRGELLVKTTTMFDGYYNREDLSLPINSEAVGWHATGDVVALLGPKQISLIDRVSSCRKLQNGKFISPIAIENSLKKLPLVHQVYVHIDVERSKVVAVIVPHWPELLTLIQSLGEPQFLPGQFTDDTMVSLCRNSAVKSLVLSRIIEFQMNEEKESPFCIIRGVFLEYQAFSVEKGFLTPSLKLCRPALDAYYTKEFAFLSSTTEASAVRDELFDASEVAKKFKLILDEVSGNANISMEDEWSKLNLDSITLTQLCKRVSNELGIPVSFSSLYLSRTVKSFVQSYLIPKISDGNYGLEGTPKPVIRDLKPQSESDLFREDSRNPLPPPYWLSKQPLLSGSSNGLHVFLTGATGFLGSHLLSHLVKLDSVKISCLLRGNRERLAGQMRFYGFGDSISTLSGKVDVYDGDISLPMFGLPESDFRQLQASCNVVLHNACLVNWILPYSALRGTNVNSIRSILHFGNYAMPIHFISSIAVADQSVVSEGRASQPYLEYGYGASKWVAEELLQRAVKEYDADVSVYRPGHLVSIDANETSRFNENDYLALLIRSCLTIQSVPAINSQDMTTWTCVNTAARLIVESLVRHGAHGKRKSLREFNIISDTETSYKLLFDVIRENYHLPEIEKGEWEKKVFSNPLSPLSRLNSLTKSVASSKLHLDCKHSNVFSVDNTLCWPPVTEEVVSRWLKSVESRS